MLCVYLDTPNHMLHWLHGQQNKYCNRKFENFENITFLQKRGQKSESFKWIWKNVTGGKKQFQYVLLK